jgi:hypothetical protein
MWNQWIFDDDLVDNTSVAWKWSPTNSTSPEVGSFSQYDYWTGTWRFGSTSGNNGEPVPELVISTIEPYIPAEFFEATRKTLGECECYCNRENYTFNFN